MEYRLSGHAEDELVIRGIPRDLVDRVLDSPQQIIEQPPNKRVYQSKVEIRGKLYWLRVVVACDVSPTLVITVYRTTKVERYWRAE